MESHESYTAARAALEWQIEMGATEAIGEAPVNRYALAAEPPAAPAPAASAPPPPEAAGPDPVAAAREAAAAAPDLAALRDAIAAYEHCELKRGARNTVFADGNPEAAVMVIGEAPGRDEDREGRPFVGRAGQLVGPDVRRHRAGAGRRGRGKALYITNIMPWRPPQNRAPTPAEIAMMTPFVERHVALAAPRLIVLMGNIACQGMLGRKGITRLRGGWAEVAGRRPPCRCSTRPICCARRRRNARPGPIFWRCRRG